MTHRDINPFTPRRAAKRDGDAQRKMMMLNNESDSNDDAACAQDSSDDDFNPGPKSLAESAMSD